MQNLKPVANFLFEAGVLSKTPRSGFRHLDGWPQSVAEHLFRTSYIGFALAHLEKDRGEKISIEKVVENCLFHDLGEARAIDLDYISQKYSKTNELQAIKDAVKGLSFGPRIVKSFLEVEEKSTKEGIIAKDADQLELLCSLKEIMDTGNTQAAAWVAPLIKRLKTESGKALAEQILATDTNDWWYENKEDDYWVKGGKNRKEKK